MDVVIVTCRSVGVYSHALTRGKNYEVFDIEDNMYRIAGDHGKRIWIDRNYFVEDYIQIPILRDWKFDDNINDFDLIEVTLEFSDGSRRWCLVTTPEKLMNHFDTDNMDPPGFNLQHLLIIKSLNNDDVERTIRYLDSQDELLRASIAFE